MLDTDAKDSHYVSLELRPETGEGRSQIPGILDIF